jgi:hypothetical protein
MLPSTPPPPPPPPPKPAPPSSILQYRMISKIK